jgi:hypothetical protein
MAIRTIICPVCKVEIQSRSRMVSDTLTKHMKEHKNG